MSTPLIPQAFTARRAGSVARSLRRSGPDLLAASLSLVGLAGATWWLFDLPASYLPRVGALYVALCGLVVLGRPEAPGSAGIGTANRITLFRATLVLPMAGLILHGQLPSGAAYWWIIVWSVAAMALDGVDGLVARKTEGASRFGARFDMELDAFLLLVLSVLVWQSGRVGPWILAVGGVRYLFVVAGWLWLPLRRELPESQRRKTVCVIQGIVLLACLGPMIPSGVASFLAAGGLALLLYSFGADVRWLVASAGPATSGDGRGP